MGLGSTIRETASHLGAYIGEIAKVIGHARCKKVGVPPKTPFRTKPQLALEQIRAAMEAGVSLGVILADGGYGVGSEFRFTLMEWGLTYVVGIGPTHSA